MAALYASATAKKRRERFIASLTATANVVKSCEIAHLDRKTAYNWRNAHPDFLEAWDEALDLGNNILEDEALRRAVEGTEKPVYQGGRCVGTVREYSDTLLIFLLKGRRPEKYGDRVRQELTGAGGGTLEPLIHIYVPDNGRTS